MDLANIVQEGIKELPLIAPFIAILAGASSVGLLVYSIFGKYLDSGKSPYEEWTLKRKERKK